jgi:hypothetical protein
VLGERKRSGKASAEGEIEPLRWLFLWGFDSKQVLE